MKIVVALLLIAFIAAMIYFTAWLFAKAKQAREVDHGEWRVKEKTLRNGSIQLCLVKPGEEVQRFGEPISSRLSAWEYEEAITERRVAAQDRADILNRRLET